MMYIPAQAKQALSALESAGYEAYIVGGCVRDALMGRTPGDYDITTSALPAEVQACFSGVHTIPTGIKHGTVTVVLGGMPLEITTFRADGEYTDHRHPDGVSFSKNLSDDLCRRDFTVNAMAYSPRRGLIDMYGGRQDIECRVLRCVGDANRRFEEDALRMLRAIRFSAVLDFDIDADTRRALDAHIGDIAYVARERICVELNKALCALRPQKAFEEGRDLIQTALDLSIAPSDYSRAVGVMALLPRDAALRWSALLGGLGADEARKILTNLHQSNALINRACGAISNSLCDIQPERISVLHALSRMGVEGLYDALAFSRANAAYSHDAPRVRALDDAQGMAEELLQSGACFTVKQLALNGSDLRKLGFEGRQIGETLNALLEDVICLRAENTHDELLNTAKKSLP